MSGFNMQRFNAAGQVFEIDPVCKMKVDPQNPPFKILYKDKTFYFCSEVSICLNVCQKNISKRTNSNNLSKMKNRFFSDL